MSFLSIAKRLRARFAASWQDEEDEESKHDLAEPPLVETDDTPPSAPVQAEGGQDVTTERMDHAYWQQQPSVVIEERLIAR